MRQENDISINNIQNTSASSIQIKTDKAETVKLEKGIYIEKGKPLPPGYGDNVLVVLVKDPYWLYSYWEFNEEFQNAIKKEYGTKIFNETQMVLRVNDLTLNNYYDIEISIFARSWYIRVKNSDNVYKCELGLVDNKKNYIKLLESNTVTLPPETPSEKYDTDYMVVKEDFEKIFKLSGGYEIGKNSFDIMKILTERMEKEMPSSDNILK